MWSMYGVWGQERCKQSHTATSRKYEGHQKDKTETREEREKDRKSKSRIEAIICFDLQNVIACPRANVSRFLYKKKLHIQLNCTLCPWQKSYNALWAECIAAGIKWNSKCFSSHPLYYFVGPSNSRLRHSLVRFLCSSES